MHVPVVRAYPLLHDLSLVPSMALSWTIAFIIHRSFPGPSCALYNYNTICILYLIDNVTFILPLLLLIIMPPWSIAPSLIHSFHHNKRTTALLFTSSTTSSQKHFIPELFTFHSTLSTLHHHHVFTRIRAFFVCVNHSLSLSLSWRWLRKIFQSIFWTEKLTHIIARRPNNISTICWDGSDHI